MHRHVYRCYVPAYLAPQWWPSRPPLTPARRRRRRTWSCWWPCHWTGRPVSSPGPPSRWCFQQCHILKERKKVQTEVIKAWMNVLKHNEAHETISSVISSSLIVFFTIYVLLFLLNKQERFKKPTTFLTSGLGDCTQHAQSLPLARGLT